MHLFAFDIEPWMIRWGFILLASGFWLINRVLGDRENKPKEPEAPRRPRAPRRQWANVDEVDQALDEVLGRQRGDIPPVPPQAGPPEVVVLRAPQPQQRPPDRPRQESRRAQKNRGAQVSAPPPMARPVPSDLATPVLGVAAETRQGLSDAVASMQSAAALTPSAASTITGRAVPVAVSVLHLASPVDVRRAILLREILGPPLALRRERR
jgi:hypothetical protein